MYKIQQLLTVFLQMVVSIYEIFQSVKSFEELEERVQRISQRATAELIQIAVEEIDERLANERDRKQLINIGKRKRHSNNSRRNHVGADTTRYIDRSKPATIERNPRFSHIQKS